ncbi:MAG TPA: ATP-binding protein [Kofleriaceae bacterium]|nr:ATP-binding protein [Kofleriaceae bacterium]
MRIPLLSTLSARIILGFAILILTFGTVSAVTVGNLDLLSREIRVIRIGYLPLALVTKDLAEKQKSLRNYLKDGVEVETTPRRVKAQLRGLRAARARLLREAKKILAGLPDLPESHRQAMALAATRLSQIEALAAAQDDLYLELLAAPPIDRSAAVGPRAIADPEKLAIASRALSRLRQSEGRIYTMTFTLESQQRAFVERTALRLERAERKLRLFTIYLGATAALVGLLITLWATLTLRPLKRLGAGARRVAAGERATRINEAGPREVAELAREFNVMARAVEERERDLVRSERLATVGKMAAMITHEIRNPLSSIGLNVELLEDELDPAGGEAKSLCRAITTEVDRLAAITDEYLGFARLPQPKLALEELSPIIDNLVAFERERLKSRGVEVVVDLDPEAAVANVDDAQLRQALLNLLTNAGDAVAAVGGGRIDIATAKAADGHLTITVTDNGAGIDEDDLPRLFEPFFSTREGGTGLGLALTHQIVRDHGGTIAVDSARGEGTRFTITLPAILR